jgi:hypothetical protein
MKKLIIALSAVSFLVLSCEKESVNISNEKAFENKNDKNVPTKDLDERLFWHDNQAVPGADGVDYGCWTAGGNCLPTVTVSGSASPIEDLVDGINTGHSIDVLNSDEELYANLLGADNVSNTINDIFKLEYRGDISSSENIYFKFIKKSTGLIVEVVPVKN